MTGGAGALGGAICLRLAQSGAQVFVCDRAAPQTENLVARIREEGGRAEVALADVTNSADVVRMFAALEGNGGVHAVIHAAAPPLVEERFRKTEWDSFQLHWEVGVRGAYNLVRGWLAAGGEARPQALVLVLSSVTLGLPATGHAAYATAKYGLWGLGRSLAVELAARGMTVNCVSPGLVGVGLTADTDVRIRDVVARATPLGRLATPEDVAGVVAFLAGPEGRYLTGLNVSISGGAAV